MSDPARDHARAELQRALDKIDIETYLDREGVEYRHSFGGSGEQLNLDECPSCGEGGRKTYINAKTGLGNCFHGSCGMKFNKFKLIRAVSGLSGGELDGHIQSLAQEQGWMPKKERVRIVMRELQLPTNVSPLPNQGRNLKYLLERGVTNESCEKFSLSYCDKGYWEAKLSDGSSKWVFYGKRVIIPILDLSSTLVSFQGRDVTGEQEPKYLFPMGYAVAGKHLFNGHAFEDGKTTHVVIGEGAFDAIAIDQAVSGVTGLQHVLAIATFGMHLSGGEDSQLEKFIALRERGLTTVTFMWDGEGKALAYAVTAGMLLRGIGLSVRIASLPSGYDPAQGPDKKPTDPKVVIDAFMRAETLTTLTAARIAMRASAMSK